jgi:enoyl-CoA hydratase/carnithine racemase
MGAQSQSEAAVDDIGVSVEGRLAVLTIDRPHARNAIASSTIVEFETALAQLQRTDISVLVVTGAGDSAFVSGGDLKDLSAIRDREGAIEMAQRMRRVLDTLSSFPVPVIAAMNGTALGGGAEVAVACDLRMAAADVSIGFNQVRLAIMPAWGGAERLVEVVGRSRALELVATGRILTAAQANAIGLVEHVVDRALFEARWRELAADFAALPFSAARSVKTVIAAVRPHQHPATERQAVELFADLWIGDEHWAAAERLMARPR